MTPSVTLPQALAQSVAKYCIRCHLPDRRPMIIIPISGKCDSSLISTTHIYKDGSQTKVARVADESQ